MSEGTPMARTSYKPFMALSLLLMGLSMVSPAWGDEPRKPMSLERAQWMMAPFGSEKTGKEPITLDQQEAVEEGIQALDAINQMRITMEAMIEYHENEFQSVCLKAIGHSGLCACLERLTPTVVGFVVYAQIVTSTRDKLGYENLGADGKALVDTTRAARDACVAEVWRESEP